MNLAISIYFGTCFLEQFRFYLRRRYVVTKIKCLYDKSYCQYIGSRCILYKMSVSKSELSTLTQHHFWSSSKVKEVICTYNCIFLLIYVHRSLHLLWIILRWYTLKFILLFHSQDLITRFPTKYCIVIFLHKLNYYVIKQKKNV